MRHKFAKAVLASPSHGSTVGQASHLSPISNQPQGEMGLKLPRKLVFRDVALNGG
jgi:hypothetical protein